MLPCRLFTELEKHWKESIILTSVCDIIRNFTDKDFDVYVKYCSNQAFQDRTLKKLKQSVNDTDTFIVLHLELSSHVEILFQRE